MLKPEQSSPVCALGAELGRLGLEATVASTPIGVVAIIGPDQHRVPHPACALSHLRTLQPAEEPPLREATYALASDWPAWCAPAQAGALRDIDLLATLTFDCEHDDRLRAGGRRVKRLLERLREELAGLKDLEANRASWPPMVNDTNAVALALLEDRLCGVAYRGLCSPLAEGPVGILRELGQAVFELGEVCRHYSGDDHPPSLETPQQIAEVVS